MGPVLYTFCFTLIQLSLSQSTTMSTSSTTESTEFTEFPFSLTLEVIVLLSIIICCPICIIAFCLWQKRKTKRCAKEHAKRVHALISDKNNEQRASLKKQEPHSVVDLQKMQGRGVMPLPFTQRIASTPSSDQHLDKISEADSSKRQKTTKKAKKFTTFQKVLSVSVDVDATNNPMESASILPVVENDVNEPPPDSMPNETAFNAIAGVPIQKKEKKEKEEEKKVDLLQIAQNQMAEAPIPSLQTLFGRRVKNKNDPESSDDDDSLFQRQRDFASKEKNEVNDTIVFDV